MKVNIINKIECSYENLNKRLPSRYAELVSKYFYGKTVNFVCFPADKVTITSGELLKAQKKIVDDTLLTLYFARNFTIESLKRIDENNGRAFYLCDFDWTDEDFIRITQLK